jgi:hypothetical protein
VVLAQRIALACFKQPDVLCITNIQSPKSAPAKAKVPKTFDAATAFFEHALRSAGAKK